MNPEPLIGISPHVFLDDVSKQLRQPPYVFFVVAGAFEAERLINLQQKASPLLVPGSEHRQHRSFGAQREFCQHESCRRRHVEKVDEGPFAIQRVQINQNPERAARLEDLKHLSGGRALVDSTIAQPRAPALDQFFNLRIIDPPHQKAQRITEQRKRETGKLPGPNVTSEENHTAATLLRRLDVLESERLPELFTQQNDRLAEKKD